MARDSATQNSEISEELLRLIRFSLKLGHSLAMIDQSLHEAGYSESEIMVALKKVLRSEGSKSQEGESVGVSRVARGVNLPEAKADGTSPKIQVEEFQTRVGAPKVWKSDSQDGGHGVRGSEVELVASAKVSREGYAERKSKDKEKRIRYLVSRLKRKEARQERRQRRQWIALLLFLAFFLIFVISRK